MASSLLNLNSMSSPTELSITPAASKQATAQSTSATSTASTGGLDGTSTGQTFLNLLVKELQNQDPTAPMDSTAMVGQMISLNQLDQLISINQVLSNATTSNKTSSAKAVSGSPAMSSVDQIAQRAALLNSSQSNTSLQAAQQAVTTPSQTLDLSNLNIPYGGK